MDFPKKLAELIEYEKKNELYIVKNPVDIKIEGDAIQVMTPKELAKINVIISVDGINFKTTLNKIFIHQVTGRIPWNGESSDRVNFNEPPYTVFSHHIGKGEISWRKEKADTIGQIYNNVFNLIHDKKSFTQLELKIKEVFTEATKKDKHLVIINHGDGYERKIYGIVSKYYTPMNQADFRSKFITLCKEKDYTIDTSNSKVNFNKNSGLVEEYFTFNSPFADDILLECGLVYGKNNGYGSYYINWQRSLKEKSLNERKCYLMPFSPANLGLKIF